ncbi:hypothetical protein HK099_005439 [Clydaea vesicula]|uniref:Uncharacterized protein n=1 Tax=Clydaea vesicula TaxID=447962 RepID=A0AAD5U3U6_9FUNG|nr:hypothetical protein HK099_005439 [Clydaea vesicula]KAJ3384900.1 hypothetical protein HDU92_003329 [Lobulomyces angularis]
MFSNQTTYPTQILLEKRRKSEKKKSRESTGESKTASIISSTFFIPSTTLPNPTTLTSNRSDSKPSTHFEINSLLLFVVPISLIFFLSLCVFCFKFKVSKLRAKNPSREVSSNNLSIPHSEQSSTLRLKHRDTRNNTTPQNDDIFRNSTIMRSGLFDLNTNFKLKNFSDDDAANTANIVKKVPKISAFPYSSSDVLHSNRNSDDDNLYMQELFDSAHKKNFKDRILSLPLSDTNIYSDIDFNIIKRMSI